MKRVLWGVVFVAVVMLFNPGVDVPLSYMPTLALVMGTLALVAERFNMRRFAKTAHRHPTAAAARAWRQGLSAL
jgi:hypothetical protein